MKTTKHGLMIHFLKIIKPIKRFSIKMTLGIILGGRIGPLGISMAWS